MRELESGEFRDTVPATATVVVGMGCGTPTTALRLLADSGAHVFSGLLLGQRTEFVDSIRGGGVRHTTWMSSAEDQDLVDSGHVGFLPLRVSRVGVLFDRLRPDVGVVRTTPPDSGGFVSLGPSASYARQLIEAARIVVAEIDPDLPWTGGDTVVHESAFTASITSADTTPVYNARPPSELSRRIGEIIVGLLPERPVLQLGIGSIPEGVAAMLPSAGIRPEMVVGMGMDPMVSLLAAWAGGDRPIKLAATELMGTRRLLDYAHRNPAVQVLPTATVSALLQDSKQFVSVVSAVEVDVGGQVNAEFAMGKQIAGVGGSVDFVEAALRSEGGMSIVALPSTALTGQSRIVGALSARAPVTIPRHSVQFVVTEHGAVDLTSLSMQARTEAMISIAHPDHRDALTAEVRSRAWRNRAA